MQNICHNIDNMQFMKTIPDKFYDLAIVDPPYEDVEIINIKNKKKYNNKKPGNEYFIELFRISKNQIIWGGNYFNLIGGCFVWNKLGRVTDRRKQVDNLSDAEIAYQSFNNLVKIFSYTWIGNVTGNDYLINSDEFKNRIHISQKPVALYKWLLQNYAKPGQKIFDSHVGSGSIRVACYDMGFDFTGCEIDVDYWQAQEDRFKNHISQNELFGKDEIRGLIFNE